MRDDNVCRELRGAAVSSIDRGRIVQRALRCDKPWSISIVARQHEAYEYSSLGVASPLQLPISISTNVTFYHPPGPRDALKDR